MRLRSRNSYIIWRYIETRAGEPEPDVFGSLETEQEPLEKNQEPEPLKN